MVSYIMQKETEDDVTTSKDRGGVGDACDLARSDLLLSLQSKRGSVFEL